MDFFWERNRILKFAFFLILVRISIDVYFMYKSMYAIKKSFHHFIANYSVLFCAIIICIIVIIWTIAFHLVEWWDLFSSFYFTTVTMSTIGYGDMAPLTHGGKIISIIYGFMGAPLFIGLTWIFFQSKFQKIVKGSIHEYHKELKEAALAAKKLDKDLQKAHELQTQTIEQIEEASPAAKKTWRKKLFWRK